MSDRWIEPPAVRTFEYRDYAYAHRVSPELLHAARLSVRESSTMWDPTLVATLVAPMLTDHVLTDDVRVQVYGVVRTSEVPRSVLVELPNPWWRRLLRRPARSVWCPVVGDAVIPAAGDTIPVTGTAVVPVEYTQVFPEAKIRPTPESFGPGRRWIQAQVPAEVQDWRVQDRRVRRDRA